MTIKTTARHTASMSATRFARTAQDIQRKYYDKCREFLATATDEQVEAFKTAIGQADTLGRFAADQEQESRKAGFTAFTVKADEADDFDPEHEAKIAEIDAEMEAHDAEQDEEPTSHSEPGL